MKSLSLKCVHKNTHLTFNTLDSYATYYTCLLIAIRIKDCTKFYFQCFHYKLYF